MTPLAQCNDLTFWYFREGVDRSSWSAFDRVWPVAVEHGVAVGSVAFDAGIIEAPRRRDSRHGPRRDTTDLL